MLQHTRCYGRGRGCCASSSSWRRTGRRTWWCGAQGTFPYVKSMENFQITHLCDIVKLLSTGESAIKWMLLVYNVLTSLNIAKSMRIANWVVNVAGWGCGVCAKQYVVSCVFSSRSWKIISYRYFQFFGGPVQFTSQIAAAKILNLCLLLATLSIGWQTTKREIYVSFHFGRELLY